MPVGTASSTGAVTLAANVYSGRAGPLTTKSRPLSAIEGSGRVLE
jgi:hypothetical protein